MAAFGTFETSRTGCQVRAHAPEPTLARSGAQRDSLCIKRAFGHSRGPDNEPVLVSMLKKQRSGLLRVMMVLGGLTILAVVSWYALKAADLVLLFEGWAVPAVALVHLLAEAGCAYAWRNVVQPPRPDFWIFFRARWVRASVASLTPVSGIGGAVAAIRLVTLTGMTAEMAVTSLVLDSTIEMATQIVFTALGFGALFSLLPQLAIFGWALTTVSLGLAVVALFVAVQRLGALRLLEAGFRRLANRWPRLSPLTKVQLHERLMLLHQRRVAAFGSGCVHLGCWLLGAAEIWVALFALGIPAPAEKCLIIESLGMTARSAGFFVPGALGIQEAALVIVCGVVGLSPETAMLIAIVKRLRDVVLGIPGLAVWQWTEGRPHHRPQFAPDGN
jgi:putative membrane protein